MMALSTLSEDGHTGLKSLTGGADTLTTKVSECDRKTLKLCIVEPTNLI